MAEQFESLNIGVDFGGVCSAQAEKYESRAKYTPNEKEKEIINIENCVEVLRELRKQGHKLYLVSFCGHTRAIDTRQKLNENYPGLFDALYFVKDRKYKQSICAFLGLDVMIDDRLDVLETISPTQTMLFNGAPGAEAKYQQPAVYKNKETGKFVQYEKFQPKFVASNWLEVLRLMPLVKSLRLRPDNQVKTKTICYE